MSGIAKASEKMKKKISFGDYALAPEEKPVPEVDARPQVDARKVYSLSKEDTAMLQRIFSHRLANNSPNSISEIMSEAISLLYKQELS